MNRLLIALIIMLLGTYAKALDICSVYGPIHQKEVLVRVRSGIPFKLLSIASGDNKTFKRIIHIKYDLWTEILTIETFGRGVESSTIEDSQKKICRALSFSEASKNQVYKYQLLLNPVIGSGSKLLNTKYDHSSSLIKINWERLAKELESERVLLTSELRS